MTAPRAPGPRRCGVRSTSLRQHLAQSARAVASRGRHGERETAPERTTECRRRACRSEARSEARGRRAFRRVSGLDVRWRDAAAFRRSTGLAHGSRARFSPAHGARALGQGVQGICPQSWASTQSLQRQVGNRRALKAKRCPSAPRESAAIWPPYGHMAPCWSVVSGTLGCGR